MKLLMMLTLQALKLQITEDITLVTRENPHSEEGTEEFSPDSEVVTLDEMITPVKTSSDDAEDLEAQGAAEIQAEPSAEAQDDKLQQEDEAMETPTKTTDASTGYDSSEKNKQKKRDQKERKRLRD